MHTHGKSTTLSIYHSPARHDVGKAVDLITAVVSALGMTAAIVFLVCL